MKKYETIKSHDEFNKLINNGKYIKNEYFVIYYDKSSRDSTYPKFGIAISTKFGKSYIRNKYKRRVRSLIEQNKKLFKNNTDYIIMIRKTCINIKYKTMLESFNNLVKEIKWIRK